MKILNDMTCVCLHSALMEFLPKGRSVCWKHNTHGLSGMQLFSSLDLFVVGVTLMRSVCRLHSSDSTKSVEFLSARMGIRSGCNLWNTKWICDSLHICVFVCDGGRRQSDRDLLYWYIMVLFVSCPLAWHYFVLFHITHRLLSQQSWELYLFVLNLTQKCRDCVSTIIRPGAESDETDDRKGCFLSRRCGCAGVELALWKIPASPCCAHYPHQLALYKAAMVSISCFLTRSTARYAYEVITGLPTVTQLESREQRLASCGVDLVGRKHC